MSKKAEIPQTDYTTGGMQISNTAIPIYQENLQRVNEYLSNPQESMNKYIEDYYSNNTDQSDFLRKYNRAMSGVTANNYAATNGGYSSLNQRNYDDTQRYQNDLASRIYDAGVTNAYNMASGDYQNMLNAFPYLQSAYNLGEAYSNIEQQNAINEQQNSNWFGNLLGGVGQVVSGIPNPIATGLGAAMQVGGNMLASDSPYNGGISSTNRGAGYGDSGAFYNPYSSIANQVNTSLKDQSVLTDTNGNFIHPMLKSLYSGIYGNNKQEQ